MGSPCLCKVSCSYWRGPLVECKQQAIDTLSPRFQALQMYTIDTYLVVLCCTSCRLTRACILPSNAFSCTRSLSCKGAFLRLCLAGGICAVIIFWLLMPTLSIFLTGSGWRLLKAIPKGQSIPWTYARVELGSSTATFKEASSSRFSQPHKACTEAHTNCDKSDIGTLLLF